MFRSKRRQAQRELDQLSASLTQMRREMVATVGGAAFVAEVGLERTGTPPYSADGLGWLGVTDTHALLLVDPGLLGRRIAIAGRAIASFGYQEADRNILRVKLQLDRAKLGGAVDGFTPPRQRQLLLKTPIDGFELLQQLYRRCDEEAAERVKRRLQRIAERARVPVEQWEDCAACGSPLGQVLPGAVRCSKCDHAFSDPDVTPRFTDDPTMWGVITGLETWQPLILVDGKVKDLNKVWVLRPKGENVGPIVIDATVGAYEEAGVITR